MTQGTRYFAAHWDFAQERARLRMIEQIYDPATTRRLTSLGVAERWRCLEVGAGAGSVARWLAERVGPSGRVVATDIDTRFLQDLDLANVKVRRHDIRADDLETGVYDVVHCRALLMHLADPEPAVRCMVAALRPGGWLLAEELDFTVMATVTRDRPGAEAFDSFVRRTIDFQRATADYDSTFGRSLPMLVRRLGLAETGNEVTTSVVWGGEPGAQLYLQGRWRFRDEYLAEGVVTEEEFERFEQTLQDPTFAYLEYLLVAAWGRRP